MAIGTSIAPRSYNVDTTGKAYTLDMDPLLDVQNRAFASQQENMRQAAAVAQKGVDFAEYVGARQQLGRVKARLGELDVNDPLFAQKYSALVAENPLAFTNEKIAPVTKAAITPVLASAAQAMESRAALERAKVMAGYQQSLADTRYQNQIGLHDYKRDNPLPGRPAAPHRVTAGAALLFGGGPTQPADLTEGGETNVDPGTNTGDGAAPTGALMPQLPTNDPAVAPLPTEDILEPYAPVPQGPAFQPEDGGGQLVEGQGDGAALTYGNGVLTNQATGVFDVTSITGDGVTARPRVVAQPPRPEDIPPGMHAVPKTFNPDRTIAEYDLANLPESQTKEREAAITTIVESDPDVIKASQAAAIAAAEYQALKDQATNLPEAERSALAGKFTEAAVKAANVAAAAKATENAVRLREMSLHNPRAAQELAERQMAKDIAEIPVYGTGEDWAGGDLLRTPAASPQAAAPAAPREPLPVSDQFRAMGPKASNDAVWSKEKTFAIAEARSLEQRLGLTGGTIIKAAADNDKKALRAILIEAQNRGVDSPLFDKVKVASEDGGTGGYETTQFGRSKTLKRSYGEILKIAAKDPNFSTVKNVGPGWAWKPR